MSKKTIATPDEVETLEPGQWVIDADGDGLCLVDTHMGFPQRMWLIGYMGKHKHYGSHTCIENATYPLHLADVDEECAHGRGHNEMGHCYRCGQIIAEPRPLVLTYGMEDDDEESRTS